MAYTKRNNWSTLHNKLRPTFQGTTTSSSPIPTSNRARPPAMGGVTPARHLAQPAEGHMSSPTRRWVAGMDGRGQKHFPTLHSGKALSKNPAHKGLPTTRRPTLHPLVAQPQPWWITQPKQTAGHQEATQSTEDCTLRLTSRSTTMQGRVHITITHFLKPPILGCILQHPLGCRMVKYCEARSCACTQIRCGLLC